MKDVSCSHAAVAVIVDGTHFVLPESLEERKRNARNSESPLIYLVTVFRLPFVVYPKFNLEKVIR